MPPCHQPGKLAVMRRMIRIRMVFGILAFGASLPGSAQAGEKIQPGSMLVISGGIICSANFIYDGLGPLAGRTFVGTASHCVFDAPIGDEVRDSADEPIGTIAFRHARLTDIADDYAFIEILPARLADVDPAMAGHPEWPTGVAELDDVAVGDLAQLSGFGVGTAWNQTTREQRVGVITDWSEKYYDFAGPMIFGDSGSGLVHVPSGRALGVASAFCAPTNASPDHPATTPCFAYGPNIATVLRRAASVGYPLRVRLAGEPAPPPPASAAPPAPAPAPASAPAPAPGRRNAKPSSTKRKACTRRARKIKQPAKRRRALKRCGRSRAR